MLTLIAMPPSLGGNDHGAVLSDSYADLEVQPIRAEAIIGSDTVDTTDRTGFKENFEEQVEPAGGLEHNELAELVGFQRYATCVVDENDPVPQNQVAGGYFQGDIGINLSGEEFQTTAEFPTVETRTPTNTDDVLEWKLADQDEPGLLDSFLVPANAATNGTAEGGGVGGQDGYIERYMNLRDMSGMGPIVDRNDDVTLLNQLDSKNIEYTFFGDVRYILYWNVFETEEGRRSFGL